MTISPRFTLGDLDLTDWPFAVEFDSDLGSPENVAEIVDSLLQDGEIVSSSRSSNRTLTLPVLIEGSDMLALADAEAALLAECDKQRNQLAVDPGDGVAPVTVFDTFRTQVTFSRSHAEEMNGVRRYVLTIPALPFARSVDEVTTVGVTSGATPTTVVVSDGSSVTNWTQISTDSDTTPSAAVAGTGTYAGAVTGDINPKSATLGHYEGQGSLVYTPASPIDMTATAYLQVDWDLEGYNPGNRLTAYADGAPLSFVASAAIPGTPYQRTTFLCPDGSVASLRIKTPTLLFSEGGETGLPGSLVVDQVVRTNQAPTTSTLRQKVTSVDVKGSARTQGSLVLEHATSALGYTMVHTYPDLGDGYTPDLRRWLTSTPGTADSSLVSGAYSTWSSAVFTVPLRTLRPGPYLLAARIRRNPFGTVSLGVSEFGVSSTVSIVGTNLWQVSAIGVVEIGDHLAGAPFTQTFTLTGDASVEFDEAWLFYVGDDASLTRIDLGTATPSATGSSNRLWIDTPTTERPHPSLWRGTLDDKSDARNAVVSADAWGDHSFQPPSVTVFTVTANALDAQVSLRHHPRWHTHAGSVA